MERSKPKKKTLRAILALIVRIKESYGSVEEDDIQAKDLADDESARKGCGPERGDEPQ